MTIPEEMIMNHLGMLMTGSEPGNTLHHLHVVAAPTDAIGPLGMPAPDKLAASVYAIAPTGPIDVERFVAQVLVAAAAEAADKGEVILFAALAQEMWTAPLDELARRLTRERRLSEHPGAQEVTLVYGACHDGRRWRGRRVLTGPGAGTSEGVQLLVGRPERDEGCGLAGATLVRKLVGIR